MLTIFFSGGRYLEDILNGIGKERLGNCRIWIISGYNIIFQEMLELRDRWPAIENAWLAKPFGEEELSALCERIIKLGSKGSATEFRPTTFRPTTESDIDRATKLSLPLRFIDTEEKSVIFANEAWPMAQNRPDIPDVTGLGHDRVKESTHWKFTPDGEGRLFKILSFYARKDNKKLIYQIATELPIPKYSLSDIVELTFNTLRDAGFLRGRFYRITRVPDSRFDNTTGLVELIYRTGAGYPDSTFDENNLPKSRIGTFWRQRIESSEKRAKNDDDKKLIYHLLKPADEITQKARDFKYWKDINFTEEVWNNFKGFKEGEKTVLNIPIFTKKPGGKEGKKICVGFLCLDKWGEDTREGGLAIQDSDIALVEKTLLAMVGDIRKKIQDERVENAEKKAEADICSR